MAQIGDLGHLGLDPVEPLASLVDRALAVAHGDVFKTRRQQQLRNGNGRRARAGGDDFHIIFLLAHDLERIGKACQRDDGRAVLVIVEDGDVALFLQLALDLKAARRGNILEVDAAERAGNVVDRFDELIHVLCLDAERECVHIAERLEEHTFALHDRHTGLGADITKAKHSAAVRDDCRHVPTARKVIALADILLNFQARLRNTGGVSEREILFGLDRRTVHHLNFALPLTVEPKRFFCVIHKYPSV